MDSIYGDNGISPIMSGVLHRNSMAVAEEGPWTLSNVSMGLSGEAIRNGWKCMGTCEICSQPITNVVTMHNAAGKRITLGLDCYKTLLKNMKLAITNKDQLKIKKAEQDYNRSKRQAAAARKIDRNKAENPIKFADQLKKLAIIKVRGASPWAQRFGADVERRLLSGTDCSLSAKQNEMIEKLYAECDHLEGEVV